MKVEWSTFGAQFAMEIAAFTISGQTSLKKKIMCTEGFDIPSRSTRSRVKTNRAGVNI
jgi:hypothetical protein